MQGSPKIYNMTRSAKIEPLSILVVEDNYGDYVLLKESIYLSSIPATEIILADSIESAISILQTTRPDVIFLDLYLPDSAGLGSLEQLRKYLGNAAVIVLSGLSDTGTALEAIGKGAQDYLAKGEFDIKLLEKTIVYALERRKSLETLQLANERYRLLSQVTNDLIWEWDVTTNNIYREVQGVKEVYGISSNEKIQTIEDWMARIHPVDLEAMQATFQEICNSPNRDSFQTEYKFLTEEEKYRVISDRGYVVRDQDGKVKRIVGAAHDITTRRKLELELQEAQRRQQRAITEATIRGQEKEREQLGIELHDNITQILATAKLYLDFACKTEEVKRDIVNQGKNLIGLATDELRKLSHSLLPPSFDEFGLRHALQELANRTALTGVFTIECNWDKFCENSLGKDQELTIYRIVQEQLNNIIKHADAKMVRISLNNANDRHSILLSIRDDGKGFDPTVARTGVGLRNITSRAELFGGEATILSAPGKGCKLNVIFPISHINNNNNCNIPSYGKDHHPYR